MTTSLQKRLLELEAFREDFLAGAYPQRSALGPGALQKNFFKSKSITSSMISVSNLEAVSTETGSLTVDGNITVAAGGAIQSGLTAFNDASNKGYWLGVDSGTPKLLIGGQITALTPRVKWDGTTLTVVGTINAESGYLKNMTVSGALDLASSGVIKSGKTAYGSGTGIWIEYNGGSPRMDIGSATRYLRWDGTNLTFTGSLSGADGTFSGSLSAATGSFTGSLTATALTITGSANFSGAGSIGLPGGGTITSSVFDINSASMSGIAVDGAITVSTSGHIKSGKSGYASGTGWYLDYNGGTPRFDIGSTSKYLRWDGSALTFRGKISDSDGSYWDDTGFVFKSPTSQADSIRWVNTTYTLDSGGGSYSDGDTPGTIYAEQTGYASSSRFYWDIGAYYNSSNRALLFLDGHITSSTAALKVKSSGTDYTLTLSYGLLESVGGDLSLKATGGTQFFRVYTNGAVGIKADATYGIATGYSTLGTLVGRWAVYNATGSLVGYVPVYNSIT